MADNRKAKPDNSALEGAHKYFTQNVLPREIHVGVRRISTPTSYSHNQDEMFLLVRAGSGTLTVNGDNYRIKANTLVNLSPFHRYRYTPDRGETLEIAEAKMNSGTYVYMIANPYYKIKRFVVPSKPAIVYLTGLMAEIAEQAMTGMIQECRQNSRDQVSMCFCYMTDLFGIMVEELGKRKKGKA